MGNQLKKIFIRPTKRETVAAFITVLYLAFQCYRTFIYPLPAMLLRPIHVASVGILCALYVPFKTKDKSKLCQVAASVYDWFSYAAAVWILIYHVTQYKRIVTRLAYLDALYWYDIVTCILVIALIVGGILRTVGLPLAIFIGVAIAYGFFAPYLPGILYYQGLNLGKFTELMIMGNSGIYGSALGPGLIYYAAVFVMVDLLAKKKKAANIGFELTKVEHEPILPRIHLLSPIVVLMGAMALGTTIQRAALYAILTVLILNFVDKKERRRSIPQILEELMVATKRTATVGMPLCGCGIIIGIITMTGLATRLSILICSIGGTHLWIGLLIAMIGCMLLGMALPTVAAYLTAYVLFMPTLLKLGIDILPANMFLFYYGIFAQITPPVCVASYTAAGIANSNSWKTGWKAFSYALCAFLAPFVFVYQPGVLLIGSFAEIVYAIFTLAAGTFVLTVGLAGYFTVGLTKLERVLCVVCGVFICLPESTTDLIGYIGAVVVMALILLRGRTAKKQLAKD